MYVCRGESGRSKWRGDRSPPDTRDRRCKWPVTEKEKAQSEKSSAESGVTGDVEE